MKLMTDLEMGTGAKSAWDKPIMKTGDDVHLNDSFYKRNIPNWTKTTLVHLTIIIPHIKGKLSQ